MSKFSATLGLALCLLAPMLIATSTANAQAAPEANPATEELLARLQDINHLKGRFEQRQYGEGDVLLVESSGAFSLLRPQYFSWEIRSPDNQLIVANAQYLWHYDADLQTVTRRPVAGNVEASPLQVLAGDEAALRQHYTVEREGDNAYILTPTTAEQGFKRLAVSFDDAGIAGMDIVDKLNQRVVVTFSELDATTPLTSADFDFTPPPGEVDLFYYDE
jgi:outer membrane lipoprotein carrier protein